MEAAPLSQRQSYTMASCSFKILATGCKNSPPQAICLKWHARGRFRGKKSMVICDDKLIIATKDEHLVVLKMRTGIHVVAYIQQTTAFPATDPRCRFSARRCGHRSSLTCTTGQTIGRRRIALAWMLFAADLSGAAGPSAQISRWKCAASVGCSPATVVLLCDRSRLADSTFSYGFRARDTAGTTRRPR